MNHALRTIFPLITLVTIAVGCATAPPPAPGAPRMAPTPYTAEQIRDANPPGTRLVFRIERAGAAPAVQTIRFASGDAERAVTETSMRTMGGDLIGEARRTEATWSELRDHAAFPADRTTRSLADCTVASGRFDCWLYIVRGEDEEDPITRRYYFAWERPGPPVRLLFERAGDVEFRMEMMEDSR